MYLSTWKMSNGNISIDVSKDIAERIHKVLKDMAVEYVTESKYEEAQTLIRGIEYIENFLKGENEE